MIYIIFSGDKNVTNYKLTLEINEGTFYNKILIDIKFIRHKVL